MPTNADIDFVIVFTTQMEKLAQFYKSALELGEPRTGPNHTGYQVGSTYLGFDQVDEEWQHPGATTIWIRVDDIKSTYQRFLELGAIERNGPTQKPWGDILATLIDLDGNVVGLIQRDPNTYIL
jgi:uncharacterized glyoxalase superfamily protein PhnB